MPSQRAYRRQGEPSTRDLVAFRGSLINLSMFGWLLFLPLCFVAVVLYTILNSSSPAWVFSTSLAVLLFTIVAAAVVQHRAVALGVDQTWVRSVFRSQLSVAIIVLVLFAAALGFWAGGWYYDTTSETVFCGEQFRAAFQPDAVSGGASCKLSPIETSTTAVSSVEYYHCSLLGNCYISSIRSFPASVDMSQFKYLCEAGTYKFDDRLLPDGKPADGKSYPFAHIGFSCYSPPAATAWHLIMVGTGFAWTALIFYIVWLALISSGIHQVVRANDVLADPYITQVDYVVTTSYPTWYTVQRPATQPQQQAAYNYPPGMYSPNAPPPPAYSEKH